MTLRRFVTRSFLFATLLAGLAHAASDPSFVLTGTSENFGTYFPSYLANGYFSTMTSVRGTEPARGYMVAFMDYAKDDIARPAAVPGWSEIDYNPGGGWLNSTRVAPQIFADYSQTLDMYDATLSTRYRFEYANKSTDVAVKTFVSQADSHIAATQLSITPHFERRCATHVPDSTVVRTRATLPDRNISGDEMIASVIASGQTLENKPIPYVRPRCGLVSGRDAHASADGDAKHLCSGSMAVRSRDRRCPKRSRSRCRKALADRRRETRKERPTSCR